MQYSTQQPLSAVDEDWKADSSEEVIWGVMKDVRLLVGSVIS
jgi:exo-beta-1,3-glucanase (GH17 family)